MRDWLKRIASTLLASASSSAPGRPTRRARSRSCTPIRCRAPSPRSATRTCSSSSTSSTTSTAAAGPSGKKFELVSFDNKSQPSEALLALKSATDQNIPVIMQCSGSNIAAALIEGVDKHNERNPNNRIVYVNCGAVATELTNEKCSYWHFRMDAHVGMKAETMVRALPKDVTKVYLLNQDYLFGQSVQRDVKTFLAKLRPDVKVVGDELIPLGKVKDFSPYITKIKASGAQALLTGNWGPDMTLLIKGGMDAGLDIRYYTMYAHLGGGATAIGPAGNGKVRSVMAFHENIAVETGKTDTEGWTKQFRSQHDFDFYAAGFRTIFEFLQAAMNKAGSADPVEVLGGPRGPHHHRHARPPGDDAEGRPPDPHRVLRGRLHQGREVRLGEDRASAGRRRPPCCPRTSTSPTPAT